MDSENTRNNQILETLQLISCEPIFKTDYSMQDLIYKVKSL